MVVGYEDFAFLDKFDAMLNQHTPPFFRGR